MPTHTSEAKTDTTQTTSSDYEEDITITYITITSKQDSRTKASQEIAYPLTKKPPKKNENASDEDMLEATLAFEKEIEKKKKG